MRIIHKVQRQLSRSKFIVNLCLKVRNQTEIIIGYHLAPTNNIHRNGEIEIIKAIIPECSVLCDIGGNLGDYTKEVLNNTPIDSNLKIHFFEPIKDVFDQAVQNLAGYENVCFYNKAVGTKKEKKVFYKDLRFSETSSFFITQGNSDRYKKIELDIDTLDNLFDESKRLIDFVKIDTEGNDFNVLKGANQLLSDKRIRFIQFEYNSAWAVAGSTLAECINYLNLLEYEVFLIRKTGLHPIDYHKYGEYYKYSNFFACLKSDQDSIAHLIKGII